MKEHGIGGMLAQQFELRNAAHHLPVAYADSLASTGTHDTPPFARWWQGADIVDRQQLGLVDPARSSEERQLRRGVISRLSSWTGVDSPAHAHQALMDSLGASPAALALVNLEDLWLKEEPHNVPGTSEERPNWRHHSALGLKEIRSNDEVQSALLRLARSRGSHRMTSLLPSLSNLLSDYDVRLLPMDFATGCTTSWARI